MFRKFDKDCINLKLPEDIEEEMTYVTQPFGDPTSSDSYQYISQPQPSNATPSDNVMTTSGISLPRDWRYRIDHPPDQVLGDVSERVRTKTLTQSSSHLRQDPW